MAQRIHAVLSITVFAVFQVEVLSAAMTQRIHAVLSIPLFAVFQVEVLSAAMTQRIHAVLSIPVFLISCFSIFCFFGGQVVGYIFFERLIIEGKYNTRPRKGFFIMEL